MTEHPLKLARLRAHLESAGIVGILLTDPASVAWLADTTTGVIDRSAPDDPLAIAVTATAIVGVTTNVEADRLRSEHPLPFEIIAAPWHVPDGVATVAEDAVGPLVAGAAHDDDLVALRLALLPGEQARLRALGREATAIVEDALDAWRPGGIDRALQAGIAAGCETRGIQPICLIVGGDDRLQRYRHPLAIGLPMRRSAMAVLVAMRNGLHVALTRYAPAGELPAGVAEAKRIESAVLAATAAPGQTYGGVLAALAVAYGDDRWRDHWQGGPIGYRQREFEIAPAPPETRWHREALRPGHAVAWNPSVAGGGKVEDTYLVGHGLLERMTER